MGSRGADWFEELGHEIEVVPSRVQKTVILCNLVRATSVLDDTIDDAGTNLL